MKMSKHLVNVKVLVLDQTVLGTWQVLFKYYLLKSIKVANQLYLENLEYIIITVSILGTDSIVGSSA